MTFEEAKKILKEEGFHAALAKEIVNQTGAIREFEKPEVCEAIKVANANKLIVCLSPMEWGVRKARLKKEYEKNTKAPGSAESLIKEDSGVNPALKESASQFNDALLDEQAKKIAELTKEKTNLEDQITVLNACKKHNDKIDRKQIKCLGKEIARLNKIIHKKNLKIEEMRKESSRHQRGKMKMFGENFDLEQELKDKNAVLSDVAEELRLSKIREKNLTELCQKYIKANEELKEKLADKVVDKIDAQALKSAESALAWKEKVIYYKDMAIADLRKELKAQKGLVNHISKKYDGVKINLNLRMKECEKLEEALEEKTKLVEIVRNGSKEYCDYGVAANEFIKELSHLYVLADKNGNINVEMLERCKNYQTYGFPANCNRETKKEINDIARGKENKKPRIPTPEEPKHDNSFEDFINKAIDNYNRRAAELGCVGSKDGNGIFDQMVGVDIAEEGGDHSAIIAQCYKNIAISKDEAEIIERCSKNGTELHYSEKDGFTYTNMFGDEIPIICLRGMYQVFADEEIKNMKK